MEGGSEPPPHQLEGLWERCISSSSGVRGGEFGLWCILGPQKSRQNGQLLNLGQQVNLMGTCPLLQRRTVPAHNTTNRTDTSVHVSSNNWHTAGQSLDEFFLKTI